jgi:hypothetical protein
VAQLIDSLGRLHSEHASPAAAATTADADTLAPTH